MISDRRARRSTFYTRNINDDDDDDDASKFWPALFLQEERKRKKKETMPFHICTDFKHARYAPNTLPSCKRRGMRDARYHRNGTNKNKYT